MYELKVVVVVVVVVVMVVVVTVVAWWLGAGGGLVLVVWCCTIPHPSVFCFLKSSILNPQCTSMHLRHLSSKVLGFKLDKIHYYFHLHGSIHAAKKNQHDKNFNLFLFDERKSCIQLT